MPAESGYRWSPIAPPANPEALAVPEMRAFERLWATRRERLQSAGVLDAFWEKVARRWSIETGIIERIYDVSAGATRLLVEHAFDVAYLQHGDTNVDPLRLIAILDDHRRGLDLVMDVVGGRRPFTVGWIKELHALLCRHQPAVTAVNPGPPERLVELPFEHGSYKKLPNNPTVSGRLHEYCPPEQVAPQMERLVEIYSGLDGQAPEVRSAWLHHAFTQIHPFQDGNGRVARALASLDFVRARLFPLVVERGDRDLAYMPALRAADAGDLRPLVRFFGECQQRTITEALSVAQDVLAPASGRQRVLEAARAKSERRRTTDAENRALMARRLAAIADAGVEALRAVALEARDAVPGATALTERSATTTAHYWTKQIRDMAEARRYWPDLREPRAWIRLQLRDGGRTDLVVVLHFIGNPSPGSCVAAGFLQHRDVGDTGETVADMASAPFTLLPMEPLRIVAEEESEPQRARFLTWLDEAVEVALAEWQRTL